MDEKINTVRAELSRLRDCRPRDLDLKALSRYKIPGKVMMALGALIWRAEELARNAIEALDREDFVTSALLTRALMETTGGVILLHNLVRKSVKNGISEGLNKRIDRFLTGARGW